ncbi:MAG TPA: hypothetical protein VLR91_05495, partial [Thermodesulfobacteriota bacterium]|nr:hypothetical protein [Thermodesulfobacteriota bacterium]
PPLPGPLFLGPSALEDPALSALAEGGALSSGKKDGRWKRGEGSVKREARSEGEKGEGRREKRERTPGDIRYPLIINN